MNLAFIDLKNKEGVLEALTELRRLESRLTRSIQKIATLKRGEVLPSETKRRSKVAGYASGIVQQINNFIYANKLQLTSQELEVLERVGVKADKVLRENITLQSNPPLDVIPFRNVPIRYSYSSYGGRELRWGYGLHMKPFNEEGESITLAEMPPHYMQSVHNHSISEYCLIIGAKTVGVYYPGGKREKIYSTKKSEIFRFLATTPHTLKNTSEKAVMNLTFKHPLGLLDWRPVSDLHRVGHARGRIIKGELHVVDKQITTKTYRVHDQFYHYRIVVTKLAKGARLKKEFDEDHFVFIINGSLEVSSGDILKNCRKKGFIVIDKGTEFTMTAKTMCRIYEVYGEKPE